MFKKKYLIWVLISFQVFGEVETLQQYHNKSIVESIGELTDYSVLVSDLVDENQWFGYHIKSSNDGNRLIIGAPIYNEKGAVFVFEKINQQWQQISLLTASDGERGDFFGSSVGISNNHIIIGASGDDYSTSTNSGSAYVFELKNDNWVQQAKLKAVLSDDISLSEVFGFAVAINGEYAIVGGSQEFNTDFTSTSSNVYVYKLNKNNEWALFQKIAPKIDSFQFGRQLDIDNDTLVISLCCLPSTATSSTNSVYVYELNESSWTNTAILKSNIVFDDFGASVGVSNGTIVVGAPRYKELNDTIPRGRVYIYHQEGKTWNYAQDFILQDENLTSFLGSSISLSKTQFVVGSKTVHSQLSHPPKPVYVFNKNINSWELDKKIFHQDILINPSNFSPALEINENEIIIGSYRNSNAININEGAVLVYNKNFLFKSGFEINN